ncbi:hypothetical protein [Undibacterium flavidum]|nr:hypothetical protein [Undibacterium flavidum]
MNALYNYFDTTEVELKTFYNRFDTKQIFGHRNFDGKQRQLD